jgi:hypothetical protein
MASTTPPPSPPIADSVAPQPAMYAAATHKAEGVAQPAMLPAATHKAEGMAAQHMLDESDDLSSTGSSPLAQRARMSPVPSPRR